MQDEEIDKLIRDAASQHHPPYDDTAWDKMEQLLDKELPQKKDRRKPAFFLLLSLLVAGGAFYALVYPGLKGNGSAGSISKNSAVEKNVVNDLSSASTQTSTQTNYSNDLPTTSTTAVALSNTTTIQPSVNIIAPNDFRYNSKKNANNKFSDRNALQQKGKTTIVTKAGIASEDENTANENTISAENEKFVTPQADVKIKNTASETLQPDLAKAESKKGNVENKKVAEPIPVAKTNNKKEDKKSGKIPANFGITASAGTDRSFINVNDLGKTTMIYGAGLSYDISKHIKVRAGFYLSKKIYSAKPSEYNAVQYPNLTNVDGNCNVYEIPVSVNYKFGAAKKHSWFAGAGLSSFIMKKEDYVYNYKTASGTIYDYSGEYKNQNKHLFSVLNLSAGYQYDISKRISIMAEPFVKIPLTGIGQGKVKLNSTGIMLTATVKPFNKKKK